MHSCWTFSAVATLNFSAVVTLVNKSLQLLARHTDHSTITSHVNNASFAARLLRTNSVTDEPDFQDLEANSDVFASDTDEANFQDRDVFVHEIDEATDVFAHDTVADREILSKKESGEPEGADSFRSGEILVCILKKYGNEIRSILSPKNIGKSKQVRALRKYGNGVRNFFPTKKFKDDTNEAKIQDLEANSNVFAHDANEANFQDLEENSNVLAPDIDEASFQDLEASSDVFAHDTNEAKIQDLEAISDVFAHDANEANFQDLEANFDDFAHDANETNFEDLEANSNVIAPDTSEASFQDLEANSDVFAHDTVADRENFIKRDSGESKVADSLKSREIPIHVLKKYGNDIQNILSPKNIGKSKEVRALRKYGNGVRNFFSPKRL
ncbi:hypothetical protein E2542_SST06217 [Spatholobus suberectus]|nr:hypothetical protein E2542_SST06217 [Spatholobus suberectus]